MIREFLCPLDEHTGDRILVQRDVIKGAIECSLADQLFIIAGPSALRDPLQSIGCMKWIRSKNEALSNVRVLMNLSIDRMAILSDRETVQPYYLTHGLVSTRLHLLELARHVALVGGVTDPILQVYFEDLYSFGLFYDLDNDCMTNLLSNSPFGIAILDRHFNTCQVELLSRQIQQCFEVQRLHLGVMGLGQIGMVLSKGNSDVVIAIGLDLLSEMMDQVSSSSNRYKFLVDLGITSTCQEYKDKSRKLKRILEAVHRTEIFGFMINSGELYTTTATSTACVDDYVDSHSYLSMSSDLHISRKNNGSISKSMISALHSSYSKVASLVKMNGISNADNGCGSQSQELYYADKLINDIDSYFHLVL